MLVEGCWKLCQTEVKFAVCKIKLPVFCKEAVFTLRPEVKLDHKGSYPASSSCSSPWSDKDQEALRLAGCSLLAIQTTVWSGTCAYQMPN